MDKQILFRPPTSSDARAMYSLVKESQVLCVNSTYYYALMARHFPDTCMVAETHGQICGFITGYTPPAQQDTLFIWQVGVARNFYGQGIGKKLLCSLINHKRPDYLEATITQENQASINLFQSVARYFGADYNFSDIPFFTEEELAVNEPAEFLMKIGPIQSTKTK